MDERSRFQGGEDPSGPSPDGMICPTCAVVYPADVRFCPNDGALLRPVAASGDDRSGSVIDGRYYLIERVGRGGMGEVYRGEHVRTRRICAVKIVNPLLARDPETRGRFIREATNAGRIVHPNVVAVYDFGEAEDGLLYLALEYVDGEPLSTLLEREGALPPARAVEIARQVSEAVGAAHELGIVHRDLKPSNIMIGRDRKGGDRAKVVDFGIARATGDEQQRLTRTGLVIGTPEYMSPEQLIGDPVDGRTDVYALGCILYQMLTGEHAFGGPTANVITRRLTEPPPRPREKNPAIPKVLDDVIVTALGRTPAERYMSMEALHQALLAAPSQPVSTGPRRITAWLGGDGPPNSPGVDPPPSTLPTGAPSTPAPPLPYAPLPAKAETEIADPAEATASPAPDEAADAPVSSTGDEPEALAAPSVEERISPVEEEPSLMGNDSPADVALDEAEPRAATPDEDEPAAPGSGFTLPDEEEERPFSQALEEEPFAAEAATIGFPADGDESTPMPIVWEEDAASAPPGRRRARYLVGAAVILALLAGTIALSGRTQTSDSSATAPADLPTAPLPVPLPAGVIAELGQQLALADGEQGELRFDAAIARLRAVEERIDSLRGVYPEAAELPPVADSVSGTLAEVVRKCTVWRQVALERREPAPLCEASDSAASAAPQSPPGTPPSAGRPPEPTRQR